MDDPWNWGVERVVQELCSLERSWEPPPSSEPKLYFHDSLKDSLREQEVDGYTLLTYSHAELCKELGIKTLKQKATLKNAIDQFRPHSDQYRLHRKRVFCETDEADNSGSRVNEDIGKKPSPPTPALELPGSSILEENIPRSARETPVSEPPAAKKRRVAPDFISSKINASVIRNIPSEADVITAPAPKPRKPSRRSEAPSEAPSEDSGEDSGEDSSEIKSDPKFSVLEEKALHRVSILYDFPSDSAEDDQIQQAAFTSDTRSEIRRGQREQVHRLMKWKLSRPHQDLLPTYHRAKLDMLDVGAKDPEQDKILPVYGDSDSDEEYDSETWKEIEAEKEEQTKIGDQPRLSHDKVEAILEDAIRKFASDWKERKHSKLARQAYQIWTNSRGPGLKKSIEQHRQDYENCEYRIAKICEDLYLQPWSTEKQLNGCAAALEGSVENRERAAWSLDVITSLTEPKRLPPLPRASASKPRRSRKPVAEDAEEILTSGSEAELDGFVVDDEPLGSEDDSLKLPTDAPRAQQYPNGNRQDEMSMNPKEADATDVLRTQKGISIGNPKTPTKSKEPCVIDLITPEKPHPTPSNHQNTTCGNVLGASKAGGEQPLKQRGKSSEPIGNAGELEDTTAGDLETLDESDTEPVKHKRRKKIIRNQDAEDLREADKIRMAEQIRRKEVLRARLKQLGTSGAAGLSGQPKIIINESKYDHQGFVYVNPEIAQRIKEHQVEGVRFMWDKIVGSKGQDGQLKPQGCLLAHTMGLGKSMQVVTLLVAISEAAKSEDNTISSQIPDHLKQSKTLVLVPASLVDNWMDEFLMWAPQGHYLGEFFKVDSATNLRERERIILTWNQRGGVLILGYTLFKGYADEDNDLCEVLRQGPNVVVTDEAHMLKNPKTKVHQACMSFRTTSRLALTGSPLANNVEEYHAMINWAAPNYLSDIAEFRQTYATPIKDGFREDSTHYQRREALKSLAALREQVAPKVQRITIAVLKHEMPPKREFVLTVPLTDVQWEAYETFVRYQREHTGSGSGLSSLACMDSLGAICAHPTIFMSKLKSRERTERGEQMQSLPDELINNEIRLLHKKGDLSAYSLSWKVEILVSILRECKRLGDTVLLFSHSIPILDYLERVLQVEKFSSKRLDGKTAPNQRQSIVKEFNQGQVDVFLISTKAGGLGLNMIAANRVVVFDAKFNPQQEMQAVGRAYRLGQKKAVFVYRLVCGGTVEDKTLNLGIWKMQLASRVVDKKNPIPKSKNFGQQLEMPTIPEQKDITTHLGKDSVLDKVVEAHRPGIRSILMMDTFEEEEPTGDGILTMEDRAEVRRRIADEEARRLGKPVSNAIGLIGGRASFAQGTASSPALGIALSFIQNPIPPLIQGATLPSNGGHAAPSSQTTKYPPGNSSFLEGSSSSRTQDVSLQPIPSNTTYIGGHPLALGQEAFQGQLTRLLSNGDDSDRQERGKRAAQDITTAISSQNEHPHDQLESALLEAAKNPRFAEGLRLSLVPINDLISKGTDSIIFQQQAWNEMENSKWETFKRTGRDQSKADPQHLDYVLQKLSSTPTSANGQRKPHKLDDIKALEAVMQNRDAKKNSHASPRLPRWAVDAVDGRSHGRTSMTPTPTVARSTSTSRPHVSAKTPFK
ncbi:P-loop containing nucleoside triphosphate hydrolase protein [Hypomontagnella monticulosa]|nr:P-loop containing nucleoside triphosphate hydrolase protein [Hypomontagnella monticulosa]